MERGAAAARNDRMWEPGICGNRRDRRQIVRVKSALAGEFPISSNRLVFGTAVLKFFSRNLVHPTYVPITVAPAPGPTGGARASPGTHPETPPRDAPAAGEDPPPGQ